MKNKTAAFIFGLVFLCINTTNAQDLLEVLDQEFPETPQYEMATFKGTRISIGHSVETRKKGVLEIMTMHKLWDIPNTRSQKFGPDVVWSRFGLEYALTDRFTFGIGGNTASQGYDGLLKYKLARQQKGEKGFPFSVSVFQNLSFKERYSGNTNENLAYTTQVLIAHKFTPNFSLQLSPTYIYRGASALDVDPKSYFATGIGARLKVSSHVSLASEYYYIANPLASKDTYGAFSFGLNWNVRYVLFQVLLTNSRSLVEDRFILDTPNNFNAKVGNLVFGLNTIFSLQLKQNKK